METMREDGIDFYEAGVLNAAFKKALRLASVVGRNWADVSGSEEVDALPIVRNETGYDFDADD